MKGVSKSIIISLIFLIVITFFLVLIFIIFKDKGYEMDEILTNLFKNILKVV